MLTLLSDKETEDLLTNIQAASQVIENLTRIVGCAQTITLDMGQTTPVPTPSKKKSHRKTRASRRGRGVAVLNEAKVLEIKRKLASGSVPATKIAEEFGVHSTTINSIKYGKTWKHVALNQGDAGNVVTLHG